MHPPFFLHLFMSTFIELNRFVGKLKNKYGKNLWSHGAESSTADIRTGKVYKRY
jgi:hypothetical protein